MFNSYYPYPAYHNIMQPAPSATSYVRLLHASPNAPAVDVYANDVLIARNLAYRDFTPYLRLRAGNYNIKVYPTGQRTNPVIDTNIMVPPFSIFTVAAIGELPNISLLPIPEPRMPIPLGKLYIRFAHLSPDAPAVDITLPDGTPLFKNVSYKQVTDYIPVDPGTYTLQARIAGTDDVVLTVPNVNLHPNRFYTTYAVGLAQGTPGLQVLIPLDGNSYLRF